MPENPSKDATETSAARPMPTTSQVALVDDDPQIREALSVWLNTFGLQPRTFGNAEALLQDLAQPDSALSKDLAGAILDINLGGMHGIALAHRLRRDFPNIPLVMMTALSAEEVAQLGTLPAKTSCIKKPFDLEALEDALFGWIH